MSRSSSPVTRVLLRARSFATSSAAALLVATLVASCGGPTDAQRLRMSGVHVEGRQEPVAAVPAGTETRLLPRHHTAGTVYRRVDENSVQIGEHTTSIRIERTVTIDDVDSEGILSISEKITAYERSVDGASAALAREQRDLDAATIRYRLTDLGEPVGELEIIDAGRFNEGTLRNVAQASLTQDTLDRTSNLELGEHRSAENTVSLELAPDARADLRLQLVYTLAERTPREARFDIEGTAELPETLVGRNRVRGTGNVSGRWTIDPRDGFAGTRNLELRLYAGRRDAGNRPVGETTTYIVRRETTITKR